MGQPLERCRNFALTNRNSNEEETIMPINQKKKFNPFFQPNYQAREQSTFYQKFKFISNYEDRFMGRCSVVEQFESNNLYLLKDTEYKSDVQCRAAVELLKNKRDTQSDHEGVLRIIEVYGKKVDGLVTNFSKCTLIMEYPFSSLKKEYNNRLLNKYDFQTQQIANVIFSTIPAFAFLQKVGCKNDKIRLAHIFAGLDQKESRVKVIDSQLLQVAPNYQFMRQKGYEAAECHDIYLAPEQFNSFINNEPQAPKEDRNKAGVFTLGATILDLCIMNSSFSFYQFYNKKMNKSDVKGLINVARKRHGLLIYKLLVHMLEFQVHKRPTFAQLEILISKPMSQSEVGSQLRLSVVKDIMNQYITTARHSRGSKSYGKVSDASNMFLSMADRQFCKGVENVMEQQQQLVKMHEQYTNGNQYIGQKKNDLKHGKGKYIFKDRSYYEGQWKDDLMHGEGQLFYSNGKVEYQGEFFNDQPNGWGIKYSPSDFSTAQTWTRYDGEIMSGEMHGRGKLYFIDGTIFEGQFHNGKIFGRGCKIEGNGGQAIEQEWPLTTIDQFFGLQDQAISINFLPRG